MPTANDEELKADLVEYLSPPARAAVVAAVDAAYADAGKQFDPGSGGDMQLFGFTVFKYVSHRIRLVADKDPTMGITILGNATGAFRFKVGPFIVAPYSCGYRKPTDPWAEFPGNDRGAGFLSEINIGQFEIFPEFETSPVALVLGHYGNPDGGLEALFVKKPVAQTQGRISRWGYVEPLYQIGNRMTGDPERGRDQVLPGPTKITRPTILPFKKKHVEEKGSEGA